MYPRPHPVVMDRNWYSRAITVRNIPLDYVLMSNYYIIYHVQHFEMKQELHNHI